MEYINIIYAVIILVLVYVLICFPRRSQEKNLKKMQEELKIGDEIITYSGFAGKIKEINKESLIIELEPNNIEVSIEKWAIAGIDDRKQGSK